MSDLTEKKGQAVKIAKTTAIGTAAVGAILLQLTTFRIVGDVVSSIGIFGLGYLACLMRK